MSEQEIGREDPDGGSGHEPSPDTVPRRRGWRRRVFVAGAAAAVLVLIVGVISFIAYRYGVVDDLVRSQFRAKMERIGIVFDADAFSLTLDPLELRLRNATFNDRVSGEKLFFIREARIGLSVTNLFAWQLTRDINVESTDINGAEVWVKFNENGRSNFSNLIEDTTSSNLNFRYETARVSIENSVVHINDLSRDIAGDANNVRLRIEPEPGPIDSEARYLIDLFSSDSRFIYDGRSLENIDIRLKAIADRNGADITELRVETPIGSSNISGRVNDWASLRYDLNIESTVDLTQSSNTFSLGTALRGVGNFKGRVSGQGESYRIEGSVDAESLAADGIYLKAIDVEGTLEGTNSNYEANGRAVAELLTFEDFRIEFPRIAGNVRGTGTDFRWVGELQAISAKSRSLSLGGLFLSDAVAEYKDRNLVAEVGNGRAQMFSIASSEFEDLRARDLKIAARDGSFQMSGPAATAKSFKTPDFKIQAVTGRNVDVRDNNGKTTVKIDGMTADKAFLKDNSATNIRADSFVLEDIPNRTDIKLKNLRADRVDAPGTTITGVVAPSVNITDDPIDTKIYSDDLRIARIEGGGATLGSLNIAGVRLTIREGRVEGSSADIDAGDVTIAKTGRLPDGGKLENVKIVKPIFVVEPSGRYRASADMSIGGGIVGNIPLGSATSAVVVDSAGIELTGLRANLMDGRLDGAARISYSDRDRSVVKAAFVDLDLSKLVAIQTGRVFPFEGKTTGDVDLTFDGTDFGSSSGSINAGITASAGGADSGRIPVNGRIDVDANSGLFTIREARLTTPQSTLGATGRFDLGGQDSILDIALNSGDASEVERLFRILDISPDIEQQMDSLKVQLAGNAKFEGRLTGQFTDPSINGRASVERVAIRGREIGFVATDVIVTPFAIDLSKGELNEAGGGSVEFDVNIPRSGSNNTSVNAVLRDVNAGNLIAAVPDWLPERLRDFQGRTSGSVELRGLPNESTGEINLASESGMIAGQPFDSLRAKAVFAGTAIDIETAEIRVDSGIVSGRGRYDRASTLFDGNFVGSNVPLPLALSFLPANETIPVILGNTDFTLRANGSFDRPSSIDVNFAGTAREVVINENQFGDISFKGITERQVLNADLTATLDGKAQVFNATVDFAKEELPFRVEHRLDQSPLRPFFALVPRLRGISIGGTGTGVVEFGGNLTVVDGSGDRVFSTDALRGSARFSQLSLQLQDTPLVATEPVSVTFNTRGITFESVRFAGGGSNLTLSGTKALTDDGINNLALDGRVNLALLNVFPGISAADTFFGGFADVSMRLAGVNTTARVTGTANIDNGAIATFIGTSRLTLDRLQGRVIFTSNQAQIEQATGYLGGGRFVASGGALIGDDLRLAAYQISLNGTNITVPLPENFVTTGDARLEISGRRIGTDLTTLIAGSILARRSLYSRDIDLANVVGARREGTLTSGPSSGFVPRFDLSIEGRDALVVRNNIADLTASVSLRLTGTTAAPQLSGRITANSGTVFFRKDRYVVQRGVLEFPPNTAIEPIIYLQAETEIQGYQIFVNLAGPLTDTESLTAALRSSPALPEQDVVSLITTGSLSNTAAGIPTLASTGLNTAAEILTDSIINNPARRATDKLFGLNVFEIDPIISGERINPSARLTVGRQINNNLRVTYATNLSQDQNQVLAFEYRVSNRLSVVAQYEQRALSNVTRNRDNFSFEVRLRRRF